MNFNERIHFNTAELIQRIETSLDQLKPYQYDSKYTELLGNALIEKIVKWDRIIRARKNDPFTIVVCGDFKRGKSSIINAILNDDISPINVTPETVTLNRISYGVHTNEAILSGGRRLLLQDTELERCTLEQIMSEVGETVSQLNLSRPIDILKDITIIDTPGLEDAERDFSQEVENALHQADAVIYVFSINYPLSRNEQLYLKSMILPQKFTKLFLVANFSDEIGSECDLMRMQDLLNNRASSLLRGLPVSMLSALDERCRQLNEKRPNENTEKILENNFDTFRLELKSLIQQKKENVLPDRMHRMLMMMLSDIEDDLNSLEAGLTIDSAAIQGTVDRLNQEKDSAVSINQTNSEHIHSEIEIMKCESIQWMNDVLEKMKSDVDTLNRFSADEIERNYPIFCIDTLQNSMDLCVSYHVESLMDKLEDISQGISQSVIKSNKKSCYNFRFILNTRTWTKGDNVGFIVGKFQLGLIGIAANGVAGLMRKKELKDNRPKLISAIQSEYASLEISIQKEIDKTYQQLETSALHAISEYFNEKISLMEQQVQQTAMVARQDDEKKEEIRQAILQIRTVISNLAAEY